MVRAALPVAPAGTGSASQPGDPPDPAAAAIEKFTSYPVSPATGLIDVGIPLYSLDYYGLSLPLELKYHSGGVNVRDPLGFTGQNWTLTPGLRISRTIRGKADEHYQVIDQQRLLQIWTTGGPELFYLAAGPGDGECRQLIGTPTSYIDAEQDIFTLQMPGLETSFVLNRNGNTFTAEMLTGQPLEITPVVTTSSNPLSNSISGFRVRNDQGITYHFAVGNNALTGDGYVETDGVGRRVGWMLRQIVFDNGQTIDFTYKKMQQSYPDFSEALAVYDMERWEGLGCHPGEAPVYQITGRVQNIDYERNRTQAYSTLVLTQITAPLGTVKLTYATATGTSQRLTSLVAHNVENKQVRSVNLTYNSESLLTRVAIGGKGAYRFTYYEETATTLRNKGFDWWGFYNNTGKVYAPNVPRFTIDTEFGLTLQTLSVGYDVSRAPSESFMSAHSLKEVHYPTGGRLTIQYEPHRFAIDGQQKSGAGLRVKRTDTYDPVSGKTITETYTYEEPHYTGKFYPDTRCLVKTSRVSFLSNNYNIARKRLISTFPQQPYFQNNPLFVWYGKVTKHTAAGKTVYTYTHQTDQWNSGTPGQVGSYYNHTYLTTAIYRYARRAPLLMTETHYKTEAGKDTPVEKTLYGYSTSLSRKAQHMVFPFVLPVSHSSYCAYLDPLPYVCYPTRYYECSEIEDPILMHEYSLYTGDVRTTSVEKRTYLGGDSLVHRTTLSYDSKRPYNVTRKNTFLPTGEQLTEQYYYCYNELPDQRSLTWNEQLAMATMLANNYVTAPMQTVRLHNGSVTTSTLVSYKTVTGKLMRPATLYQKKGNGYFNIRVRYEEYDNFGNPRYVVKDDCERIFYIWGYKGMYPVAELRNATPVAVKRYIPEATLDAMAQNATLQSGHFVLLRTLRSTLDGVHCTLMQYHPLIGIRQFNDPRDIFDSYTYDSYGRLSAWWRYPQQAETRLKEEYKYNYVNN
ncbi:MAG: hypothetical protein LIP08_15545 [Bacteroides sp.]|nr:hypothetical protein [Bacteroides sp.]